MNVIIIGAGNVNKDHLIETVERMEDPFMVGVDGGIKHIIDAGIKPDIVLGDMDSVKLDDDDRVKLAEYIDEGTKEVVLPTEKDDTDSEHAMHMVLDIVKPGDKVVLLGMSGTRLDHTISNVIMLRLFAMKDIDAFMADEHNVIRVLGVYGESPASVILSKDETEGKYVSVIPLSDVVEGLTIKDAKYEVTDFMLDKSSGRCISNESLGKDIMISIKTGEIILIISRD